MGPSNSAGAERWEPIANINITPLVDVSLVLVIIFMLTMPYLMEKGMKVGSANEAAAAEPSLRPVIVIEIDRSGVRVDGQAAPMREISPAIKRLIKEHGSSSVEVSAARDVAHGQVVAVMDRIADAGISDINLRQPEGGSLVR